MEVEEQVLKQEGWRGTPIQVDYQSNMISLESGYASCSLPLPIKTGVPVYVKGYFDLSSNRRALWDGSGDGSDLV
eukprot:gene6160-7866_t